MLWSVQWEDRSTQRLVAVMEMVSISKLMTCQGTQSGTECKPKTTVVFLACGVSLWSESCSIQLPETFVIARWTLDSFHGNVTLTDGGSSVVRPGNGHGWAGAVGEPIVETGVYTFEYRSTSAGIDSTIIGVIDTTISADQAEAWGGYSGSDGSIHRVQSQAMKGLEASFDEHLCQVS